VNTAILLLVKY